MASPTLAAVGEQSPDEPLDELVIPDDEEVVQSEPVRDGTRMGTRMARPYPTMQRPLAAPSHELYPNFTPPTTSKESDESTVDLRISHPEVEDDYNGNLWARDDSQREEVRMVEWNATLGRRERWVGPMLYAPLLATLVILEEY